MKWVCLVYAFLTFLSVLSDVVCDSLVVSSTEPSKEKSETNTHDVQVSPQIYSMHIEANVSNRFARTLITSKVRNLKNKSEETTFSVILPENAFISEFEMEIEGKIYKAYVKEKEEAKKIYEQAVSSGQSAAHVETSARDSKTFTVSVNVEPESKTIFRLVYEELLQRQVGQYELVINIHPGQLVEDLSVQVNINESRPLTFVTTPSLRTGNEISKNDEKLKPSVEIEYVSNNTAIVKFHPDVNEQKKFGEYLGGEKEKGLSGQFVVQYDVDRDPQGGEVLVRDGYFVHFFAPSELETLPKHTVFVLDHSGSMSGRKFDQVVDAMKNILSQLTDKDLLSIIRFANDASVWNVDGNNFTHVDIPSPEYGHLEPHLKEANLPQPIGGTKENIEKAKHVVENQSDMGLTNIISGLEIGLFLIKRTQEKSPNKYQPMIIFLTDGLPNVGISSDDEITKTVTKLNSGKNRASIFSLSFGEGANKEFLRQLSSQNLGLSRHIYEAADASLQLQNFYRTISSPLLTNITFKYVDGVSQVTKTHYPIFFRGSELVVAGKVDDNYNILPRINCISKIGRVVFNTSRTEPVSSIERLWAFLTVKQILKEREVTVNATELTKKALDLSLKYSFVTGVSSLVVVKPNKTDVVGTEKAASPRPNLGSPRSTLISRVHYGRPYVARSRSFISARRPSHVHYYRFGEGGTYYGSASTNFNSRIYGGPITTSTPSSLLLTQTPTYEQNQNVSLPQWLNDLQTNNTSITTSQGTFKLGQKGAVTIRPDCPMTPLNGTGVCTIIFDCPQVFSFLTDIAIYKQYFCPLNEYAGVCCPII